MNNKKLVAVLTVTGLVLCLAGGYLAGSYSSKEKRYGRTPMTLTFEITRRLVMLDKSVTSELKFIKGTEAAWSATYMSDPPSFDQNPEAAIWISFVENTLPGGSGPLTAIPFTNKQARMLKTAPVGTRVIITYYKMVPPSLRSSLVDSMIRGNIVSKNGSVSSSDKYLEGWLAKHARYNFNITVQQP